MRALLYLAALSALVVLCAATTTTTTARLGTRDLDGDAGREKALARLSDYGFFEGRLAELRPAANVYPYALNTPLFSDYAHKARFVYLPAGTAMHWRDREVLDLPVGAYLIKHFYYLADERAGGDTPDARRLVETRLLKHTAAGWKAWGYWWDDDQRDARYKPLGGKAAVTWIDARGETRRVDYEAPNQFECKSCHSFAGELRPIGPSARQLHGGADGYLATWVDAGLVTGAPADRDAWPAMDWRDPAATPEESARAYLDANCGYCHRHEGPASTSGLFLAAHYPTGPATGVRKSPVAAGKGSGGLKYDVYPGKPDKSILYYRMASDEAAVRMPEVGRSVAHEEGLAVVRAWIEAMPTR